MRNDYSKQSQSQCTVHIRAGRLIEFYFQLRFWLQRLGKQDNQDKTIIVPQFRFTMMISFCLEL